jgi:hypothetical protein
MKRRALALSALLSAGCGAATEDLAAPGSEFRASTFPEDPVFGAALDLRGDLLVVIAEAQRLEPAPDEWTGAVLFYRRDGEGWRLEDQQDVPASWLIEPALHIVDGRVVVVSPFDGRCRGEGQLARAQSGSVYVYEGGPGGWALTAQVCAPDPQTGFGAASARAGDTLIVESTLRYGRPPGILARVEGTGGAWQPRPVADVAVASLGSALASDGERLARIELGPEGWTAEVRLVAHPSEIERRWRCPDGPGACHVAVAPSGVLTAVGSTLQRTDGDGRREDFELAGAGRLEQLVAAGDRAVALDEDGRLYVVRLDGPPGSVLPTALPQCARGVTRVAFTPSELVLPCVGELRGWVLSLDGQ